MGMMGTYQSVAILDCSSGIHLETYDSRDALLLGLLEACEPGELVRLRTVLIPEIEAERARFDAENETQERDESDTYAGPHEAEWNEEEDADA